MKSLLAIICALLVPGFAANAQTSSSSTTTSTTTGNQAQTSDQTTTSTATTENVGVISEFMPGSVIVLKTESGEPVRYKLSNSVTYINAKGKEIQADRIRRDRKVRVHYVKEGNDMVVDKVTVVRD